MTRAWVPGDDDPTGNWMRWALDRYCFDSEGQVVPALVDAMDRWPFEVFEQIVGVGAEKSDLACAWQEFRHARVVRDREVEQSAKPTPRPSSFRRR